MRIDLSPRRALSGQRKIKELTIDVRINQVVQFIDLRTKLLRIKIKGSFIGGDKVVECSIKNANNFRRFVVHDRVEFLVIKERNRKSAGALVKVAVVGIQEMRLTFPYSREQL